MGLYLIWGIPVLAYDEETGEPTQFCNKAVDDWREFEGDLEILPYGQYHGPERGILTSNRVKRFEFDEDCQKPIAIPIPLANEVSNDKLYSKSEDEARSEKLNVSFYQDARWWLVASYA